MNDIIDLLCSHRSIRKFSDKPISEEQLSAIIRAGNAAATSSNLQVRTVIRVTDKEVRAQMAQAAGPQPYIAEAPEYLVFCGDFLRPEQCSNMHHVPMVFGMMEQFILATVDVALMAQNCVIAAESMGLGVCYIGGLRNDPTLVSDLLHLPEQTFPLFGLCLGYPAQAPELKPRLPVSVMMKQDRYNLDDASQIAAYDQQMRDYYQARTGGTKDSSWSEEISDLLSRELRPHMRGFLDEQGFKMD